MTFLSLLIDTINRSVSVPIDKLQKALVMIENTLKSKKITIKTLQQLCGTLNFLCRAIVRGRAFLTRMYAPLKICDKKGKLLKQHHHVKVMGEMKADLSLWKGFLQTPLSFIRPFIDFLNTLSAPELLWFTDLAKRKGLGFSGILTQTG